MNINLTAIDRKILNLLQQSFPISSQPYAWLAKQLDITETELLERIAIMKKAGIIRRLVRLWTRKNWDFHLPYVLVGLQSRI
ncbi:Lrp/AsnC family transcriptional regulator [Syntrophomonas palmitatica]|uniref:Lrp/AsnC family transcriptional regulator n=1 Tax=Syntrophomonas palmitatica TaxID=402877 RepID=UPI001FA7DC77|nr:Lrp/AsnC family transcriptional regulator [Syntrophomonas palmitatica]